jgi:glycosyltransferase involved in cell wall biosynthesis
MLVSIITAYYNRENNVTESIQSLLDQTYENLEIIVIDDGSTDNTAKKLHEFNDPRLKVIVQDNMGLVKSFRKAVSLANGEIIAVHGSGDISHPQRIEKQLKVIQENPEVGVVGCYVYDKNLVNGDYLERKPVIPKGNLTDGFLEYNYFTHGEVMYTKKVYEEVGGYREFFKFAQDRDLWLRLSLVTKFSVVPEFLYTRFTLPDGVSASIEKRIIQKSLAELSRQCIKYRREGKKDLVDNYGVYAPFFMDKSKLLSRDLAKASFAGLRDKKWSESHVAVKMSKKNKLTVLNIFISLLLILATKSKKMYKISLFLGNRGKKMINYIKGVSH